MHTGLCGLFLSVIESSRKQASRQVGKWKYESVDFIFKILYRLDYSDFAYLNTGVINFTTEFWLG